MHSSPDLSCAFIVNTAGKAQGVHSRRYLLVSVSGQDDPGPCPCFHILSRNQTGYFSPAIPETT